MLIRSYQFRDIHDTGWKFSELHLGKINLFVGATGSGKSRLLNTIYNISSFVSTNKLFREGIWNMVFEVDGKKYQWEYKGETEGLENNIISERLSSIDENNHKVTIFNRDENGFFFGNSKLPKLPKSSTGLFLLKDEDLITPVHEGFGKILRRNFFGSELEDSCAITNMPHEILTKLNTKDEWNTAAKEMPLNIRLHILKNKFKNKFDVIVDEYKSIFPSVEDIMFVDGSKFVITSKETNIPVLAIKERQVVQPIPLHELSSGMQKVLLILTDVLTIPKGSIYIIDEYENSLGVNAINFLPGYLAEYGEKSQFIITSHHPYLINNMSVSSWHVFHRIGSEVSIKSGEELQKKYGKSKQDAFIQLLNDPLYSGA